MFSRTGRARLVCLLCVLALALVGPAASAYAQDDGAAQSRRRRRKHHRPRSESRRPSTSAGSSEEPSPAPAQPDWGAIEEDEPEEDIADQFRPVSPSPPPEPRPVSPPPRAVTPPPADGDEMVIYDEEAPPSQSASTDSDGDMVISDPELEQRGGTMSDDRGWGGLIPEGKASHSTSSGNGYDVLNNTGVAHLELIGQQGIDMHHEGDLEDAYESRLRFDAEVEFRRSRKTRISIGLRTDMLWALPARGDPALYTPPIVTSDGTVETGTERHYTPLQQDRWELDILPLSAYVDHTFGESFHLRVGEQPTSMRRVDFYSPIDIVAAYDLRGQPKLDPAAGRLSQPAVRVDWDLSNWATFQLVYLPWFMPNLQRPNRDQYVATILGTRGATPTPTLAGLIDPSYQTKASESALRFVGPDPNFTNPQVESRLTMRGSSYEFGVSGGTALEKNPSVYLTPIAEAYAQGKQAAQSQVLTQYVTGEPLLSVEYHRYTMVGLDGSFDLAPLQFGWELAYSPSRHLTAATKDGSHLPQPNVSEQITDGNAAKDIHSNVTDKSIRKGVPLLQGAFHVDWIKGEKFALAAEGFFVKAMKLPYDLSRDWWGFVPGKGIYAGGLLGGSYTPNPDTGRVRFDLSVVTLIGPSLIMQPQIELKVTDGFYMNCGAQIFEGPRPTPGGAQNINIGGLFNGYDQFLVGFRYLP